MLQDHHFKVLEDDIPAKWKKYSCLICGPRTILFSPDLLATCVDILCDIRKSKYKRTNLYYPSEYYLSLIETPILFAHVDRFEKTKLDEVVSILSKQLELRSDSDELWTRVNPKKFESAL